MTDERRTARKTHQGVCHVDRAAVEKRPGRRQPRSRLPGGASIDSAKRDVPLSYFPKKSSSSNKWFLPELNSMTTTPNFGPPLAGFRNQPGTRMVGSE